MCHFICVYMEVKPCWLNQHTTHSDWRLWDFNSFKFSLGSHHNFYFHPDFLSLPSSPSFCNIYLDIDVRYYAQKHSIRANRAYFQTKKWGVCSPRLLHWHKALILTNSNNKWITILYGYLYRSKVSRQLIPFTSLHSIKAIIFTCGKICLNYKLSMPWSRYLHPDMEGNEAYKFYCGHKNN